jgi:hypothetical protein
MKIDELGRPTFAKESARAFNWLHDYTRLLLRYTVTKGKAEEIESVIRYALATPERRLDVGFMVLDDCARQVDAPPELSAIVLSTPLAVTDEMKLGALEGFIDSLRLLVIERTVIEAAP